jgi:hypothetical protein
MIKLSQSLCHQENNQLCLVPLVCWKSTGRCYNHHQIRKEVNFSGNVLRSLMRAVNVFCGLKNYDYLALDTIPLWGFTTVDICCFRGVTALVLTTLVKALGFRHYSLIVFHCHFASIWCRWRVMGRIYYGGNDVISIRRLKGIIIINIIREI